MTYFSDKELKCHCENEGCDGGNMHPVFIKKLTSMRRFLNIPFPISSAFRCADHNKSVGGAVGSYHTVGRAVDIQTSGNNALRIICAAKDFGFIGIGISQSSKGRFIHLDDRTGREERIALFTY